MKFVDDRYSSGLNTSVTFYEIYWLVNRSRDKLVRCQSVYCLETGKMPFVYRTFERHDIGFWFEVACASLMPSFFLSSHLFSLLLFSSFRIVDQVVLSWELGFISATQSLALSLFDLINYTSHKWQKELVFNYSYLSWFTLTRQPIEYSLLFSIFFWAKNEILLLNISNGISIVLTIFNNYFPRTVISFFFPNIF